MTTRSLPLTSASVSVSSSATSRSNSGLRTRSLRCSILVASLIAVLGPADGTPVPRSALAQTCPDSMLANHTGTGTTVCPCFISGEEAGSIFTAPADHYPIEILKIQITWLSYFGGSGQSLEQGIHIYPDSLPNPGVPQFTLPGPVLTDGFINDFDISGLPAASRTIASGPFTVTLEFLNSNANDFFAGSVVHDGNGCTGGRNVVFAIPGGWTDACLLGIGGDWIFTVIYQPTCTSTGIGDQEYVLSSGPAYLFAPWPNPVTSDGTTIEFQLSRPEQVDLLVYDIQGRRVAEVESGVFPAGRHVVTWNRGEMRRSDLGSGTYFLVLQAGSFRTSRKISVIQ